MNGWNGNGPPSSDSFVGNGLSAKENEEAVVSISSEFLTEFSCFFRKL